MSITHHGTSRFLSSPVLPGAYVSAILALNPVAYYRMNDPYGATMVDSSGNHNNGVYSGTVAFRQVSLITKDVTARSVSLDGITGHATGPALPSVVDSFTLECWAHPLSITELGGLISLGGGSGYMRFTNASIEVLNSNVASIATSLLTLPNNSTNHIVYTKNGANVHIYLNGGDQTGTVANSTAVASSTTLIGCDVGPSSFFTGNLQEVAIYNYALSAAQVQTNYNNGTA